jgi:PAP2 superfamily
MDREMTRHALRNVAWEAALVLPAVAAYFAIRNVTAGGAGAAFENADRIVRAERLLGILREESVQAALLGNDTIITFANWVYIWGHWPVILATGVALFLWRRDRYRLLRNAMFVSGAIGFLFFAFFPVAPPRLLDLGLVDTVTRESSSYRALQPPGLTNQYAAFPSLHAGWNVLVGIVLFGTTAHIAVRTFAILSPLAMMFAVVATANHFVLDVAGGIAVVLVGLAAAIFIERSRTGATLLRSAGELPRAGTRGAGGRGGPARTSGRAVSGARPRTAARRARPAGRRLAKRPRSRLP